MSRANLKLMTLRVYQKFINKFKTYPQCQFCRKDMILNEEYVSMKAAHYSRAKAYHPDCADRVNIIYDE